MTMSSDESETSTGSRIRQFGLYRTIDARTDDFLKSSKKRQIRQGCACAAISTAITVTVVVSVILVYEFSIRSESIGNKKISIRPNWFGSKNETDITQLDFKSLKKHNLDRTTLKLLPILLKALNKNRYLDKILDKYASSTPAYETDDTEEYFKRNIFSDSKNWLKPPSSKIYTVDYKTSPYYIQHPSQRLDYLSRIRKIRNYERMINYFDKMVGEKVVNLKTEQKIKKVPVYTERPFKATSSMTWTTTKIKLTSVKNDTKQKIIIDKNITDNFIKNKLDNAIKTKNFTQVSNDCKCPKNIPYMLKKILQNLQDLLPSINTKEQSDSGCGNKIKSKSDTKETKKVLEIQKAFLKPITQRTIIKLTTKKTVIKSSTVTTGNKSIKMVITKPLTLTSTTEYTRQEALTTTQPLRTPTVASIQRTVETSPTIRINTTSLRKPKEITINPQNKTINSTIMSNEIRISTSRSTSTMPISSTDSNIFYTNLSSAILANMSNTRTSINEQNIKDHKNSFELMPSTEVHDKDTTTTIEVKTFTSELTTPTTVDITATLRGTTELIVPFRNNYLSNEVPSSPENTFDSVAVVSNYKHPIEPLFKDEAYDEFTTTKSINYFKEKNNDNNFVSIKISNSPTPEFSKSEPGNFKSNMRKLGLKSSNYHPVIKNKDMSMRKMSDLSQIQKSIMDDETTPNPNNSPIYESEESKVANLVEVHPSMSYTHTGLLRNLINIQESNEVDAKNMHSLGGFHGNNENLGEDEFQDELITHRSEVTESVMFKKPDTIFNDEDWEKMKSDDKINYNNFKSMLPPIRPIYLEVRRNSDWKTEPQHTDYDINLTNNMFDLP